MPTHQLLIFFVYELYHIYDFEEHIYFSVIKSSVWFCIVRCRICNLSLVFYRICILDFVLISVCSMNTFEHVGGP